MRLIVCSIRDRAADVFGQPFYVAALGQAVRSFADEVNRPDEKNTIWRHPEDFDLYELGVFDDASGVFDPSTSGPRQVAIGKDLKRKEA